MWRRCLPLAWGFSVRLLHCGLLHCGGQLLGTYAKFVTAGTAFNRMRACGICSCDSCSCRLPGNQWRLNYRPRSRTSFTTIVALPRRPHELSQNKRRAEGHSVLSRETPQISFRRSGRGRGSARLSDDCQRTSDADRDAVAEHVASEGHLSRIRQRFRQEGQRHDRWRAEDRGAAGGRGGSGVRPARCGHQRHARRRPWRARLSLWQAERACAVGLRSVVWHGRQHAAVVAQVRWRQGSAGQTLQLNQCERGVVPVRSDADAAARLVQKTDHEIRGYEGAEVPHCRLVD